MPKYVNFVPNMSILCQVCLGRPLHDLEPYRWVLQRDPYKMCMAHLNVPNMSILCQICQYCAKYVKIVPNMWISCRTCQERPLQDVPCIPLYESCKLKDSYILIYRAAETWKLIHTHTTGGIQEPYTHISSLHSYMLIIGRQSLKDSYTLIQQVGYQSHILTYPLYTHTHSHKG